MTGYISKQLRLIHLYALQCGTSEEIACENWVSSKLAERYEKMFGYLNK